MAACKSRMRTAGSIWYRCRSPSIPTTEPSASPAWPGRPIVSSWQSLLASTSCWSMGKAELSCTVTVHTRVYCLAALQQTVLSSQHFSPPRQWNRWFSQCRLVARPPLSQPNWPGHLIASIWLPTPAPDMGRLFPGLWCMPGRSPPTGLSFNKPAPGCPGA
jgi:hypothetical protein